MLEVILHLSLFLFFFPANYTILIPHYVQLIESYLPASNSTLLRRRRKKQRSKYSAQAVFSQFYAYYSNWIDPCIFISRDTHFATCISSLHNHHVQITLWSWNKYMVVVYLSVHEHLCISQIRSSTQMMSWISNYVFISRKYIYIQLKLIPCILFSILPASSREAARYLGISHWIWYRDEQKIEPRKQ